MGRACAINRTTGAAESVLRVERECAWAPTTKAAQAGQLHPKRDCRKDIGGNCRLVARGVEAPRIAVMSANGTKRTSMLTLSMSAFKGKADMFAR